MPKEIQALITKGTGEALINYQEQKKQEGTRGRSK